MTLRDAPRLLLTAAGTGTAYAYAMALTQYFGGDAVLFTADTNPASLVSAASLAECHLMLEPFSANGAYLEQIRQLIVEHGITHYLPIIDPEIAFAARHRQDFPATVIAPDAAFAAVALRKDRYAEALEPLGIRCPQTFDRVQAAASLPCYAKQPGGFGGRGTRLLRTADELAALVGDWLLQACIEGPEYTVDCFPIAGEAPVCSVRRRVEIKSGVCTKAHIAPNPTLESYAARIASLQATPSPFCFQVIRQADTYHLTDLNPRLGAGTAMSGANGTDFFAAHLLALFGRDAHAALRRIREECYVTRQYVEFLGAAP